MELRTASSDAALPADAALPLQVYVLSYWPKISLLQFHNPSLCWKLSKQVFVHAILYMKQDSSLFST